jgi:transcriptional regulator with XRE-family HTH domain
VAEATEDAIDRFYADVGRRIRDQRVKTGATQAQLAVRVGMTRSSIANVEAGRQRAPLHVVAILAAVLEVEPTELFSAYVIAENDHGLPGLATQLEKESATTREFIEGAIAQLGMAAPKGGDESDGPTN